jgi:hypothetical protein
LRSGRPQPRGHRGPSAAADSRPADAHAGRGDTPRCTRLTAPLQDQHRGPPPAPSRTQKPGPLCRSLVQDEDGAEHSVDAQLSTGPLTMDCAAETHGQCSPHPARPGRQPRPAKGGTPGRPAGSSAPHAAHRHSRPPTPLPAWHLRLLVHHTGRPKSQSRQRLRPARQRRMARTPRAGHETRGVLVIRPMQAADGAEEHELLRRSPSMTAIGDKDDALGRSEKA